MSRAIIFDAIFAIVCATMMVDDCAFLMGVDVRMARWRVDIMRRRAEKAAKQFDIPPERQNRISVEKMSKGKD
jgi:hypothetical protein